MSQLVGSCCCAPGRGVCCAINRRASLPVISGAAHAAALPRRHPGLEGKGNRSGCRAVPALDVLILSRCVWCVPVHASEVQRLSLHHSQCRKIRLSGSFSLAFRTGKARHRQGHTAGGLIVRARDQGVSKQASLGLGVVHACVRVHTRRRRGLILIPPLSSPSGWTAMVLPTVVWALLGAWARPQPRHGTFGCHFKGPRLPALSRASVHAVSRPHSHLHTAQDRHP